MPTDAKADPNAPLELALELPLEGIGSESYWTEEVERSEKRKAKKITKWRRNIERYEGAAPTFVGMKAQQVITVNADFYNTEQKKAQLFFNTPDVQLTPLQPGLDQAAVLFQRILNQKLGPNEIDARSMVDECLFDVICPSGIGPSKIHYRSVTEMVMMPTGEIDPLTLQPAVDPLTGQPKATQVPRVVWEKYAWDHFSPAKLLTPAGFLSTRYDDAPWIGMEVDQDADLVKDQPLGGKLDVGPNTEESTLASPDDRQAMRETTKTYEIWYKASLYDETVKNPELIRRLVMVQGKGHKRKITVHENSTYQKFDSAGAFVQGMRGYPIHPLVTRRVTDSPYPPSDCEISRHQVDELSRGRSQMMKQRDRNVPLRGFNVSAVDKAEVEKIKRGEIQELIPFTNSIQEGDFKALDKSSFPPENFQFNAIAEQDIAKLWALGANQQGVTDQTSRTATELSLVERAKDTRLASERRTVELWYGRGVEKLSCLVQLFAGHDQVVSWVGEDGAAMLETWDKSKIQGRFAFSIKPDSSVRVDAAEERAEFLRLYNLTANDPYVNRQALIQALFAKFNQDPKKYLVKPPEPKPEPPKIGFSFKAEDLGNPIVIALLQQAGFEITPEMATQAHGDMMLKAALQAENPTKGRPDSKHGGAAKRMSPIEQHDADLTGERPGAKPLS